MFLLYILIGFIVKLSTGLDDALIHIPIVSNISKTRVGQFSYALGFMLAVVVAIFVSIGLAKFIRDLPFHNYIAGGLIFMFALIVYFDLFALHVDNIKKPKYKRYNLKRIITLIVMGFSLSLITIIDDVLVFSTLFINADTLIFTVMGILFAAFFEITLILFLARRVKKIKYQKELSTVVLIILSLLVLFGII